MPTDETGKGKSDYFLDSADRIHFFIEKSAADKDPNVNVRCEFPEGLNSGQNPGCLVYRGIIGDETTGLYYGDCNKTFHYPTSIWNAKKVLNAAQVLFDCLIFAQRLSVHHVKVYLQRKDGKLKAGQTKFESLNKAFPKSSAPHQGCTSKTRLRAQISNIPCIQHTIPYSKQSRCLMWFIYRTAFS